MHKFLVIVVVTFILIFLIYSWIKGNFKIKGSIVLGFVVGGVIGASMGIVAFGGGINAAIIFGPLGAVIGIFIVNSFSKEEDSSKSLENDSSKNGDSSLLYVYFLLISVFLLIIYFSFIDSPSYQNTKKVNEALNFRLKNVTKDEIKICEKEIINKNPNINIVEINSYNTFEIIRNNNLIKKKITLDVKKKVFILGEMSLGIFNCFFLINNDGSFKFLNLTQVK